MKFKTKGRVAARVRDFRATGGGQMETQELSIEPNKRIMTTPWITWLDCLNIISMVTNLEK